jgi:prephenate dehydrogenase
LGQTDVLESGVFERVVIVGAGLLGASLGLAIKSRGLARRVVGVGRRGSASVGVALERGAIDEAAATVGEGSAGAELVVLCTPVGQFRAAMEELKGFGGVVTDVGSTKGEVMGWGEAILGGRFVGSHPMAGSEKRGPEHARGDLIEGALCFVVGGEAGAAARVEGLWRAVGMRTVRAEAAAHDRWVAAVSHLPHAVAFALMNAAGKEPAALEAAAGSFLDMTRVAGSDVEMWTDIFMTNREAVAAAVDGFAAELAGLREAIAGGDAARVREILARGRAGREGFVAGRAAMGEKRRAGDRGAP